MSKFLIAGLGNPGAEYAHTRHNIGFDVVSAFAIKYGGIFKTDRLADVCEVKWKGKIFCCIKPNTYMNLSGRAFKYWMDKENVALENTLTVTDDLALPLSKLRLRPSGSDGGHNGLKDIQAILQTGKYARLRFGIGNAFNKGMQVNFVLGKWTKEEQAVVNVKVEKSIEVIENWAVMGIEKVMSAVNNYSFI